MRSSWKALGLASLHIAAVAADYQIGTFPAPTDLTSNQSLVLAAWKNITSTFDDYLKEPVYPSSGPLLGVENITFSIGMFSLHDPDARRLQYHYVSPEIRNASIGTRKVDENTIYRVASISKLITAFVGMVELTPEDWNRPLTEINPAFSQYPPGFNPSDPVTAIQWDKVTPWALATQLSGIPATGLPLADLYNPEMLEKYGAPPIDISTLGTCAVALAANLSDVFCPAQDAIAAVAVQQPSFKPWTNPSYSNLNFMLLGIAMSNITQKELPALYQESLFDPLGMSSTFYSHPEDPADVGRSVIPDLALWALETITTNPSGGILSTISDLQKLGIGILDNTLLSPEVTQRWMKPVSQGASLSYTVGAPWEIHRYVHPDSGRVTDLYTKLGDSGDGGGALALIPQYDAGFVVLDAASAAFAPLRSSSTLSVLDQLTNTILPALEAQALAQAKRNFIGTYKSTDPNLVASVTIAYNETDATSVNSGLQVTEWTYNGTDVLNGAFFADPILRLEQSIPNQAGTGCPGKVGFKLSSYKQTTTYMEAMQRPELAVYGPWTGFYGSNLDFIISQGLWGGVHPGTFIFEVDEKGRATTCSPAVDRVTLKRVDK